MLRGPANTASILSLQRLAGNRATAQGLQRKVETPGGWFAEHNILGEWRNELILKVAATEHFDCRPSRRDERPVIATKNLM